MRTLFNPLRCDIYNVVNGELVHHQFIGDPLFRVIATTVSNSCILFKSHIVYGEFSTVNLIAVKFNRARQHVVLLVKTNITFVTAKYNTYSLIFGTPYLARQFYQTIIKHVHRSAMPEPVAPDTPSPLTVASQPAIHIVVSELEGPEVQNETIVCRDSNEPDALEHLNDDNIMSDVEEL